MVFTIPKRLRIFFRYDRKLLGELAGCAWRALKLYFDGTFDGADVTPGAAGFLQTSGELLNFHPHVHVLVTDGGSCPTVPSSRSPGSTPGMSSGCFGPRCYGCCSTRS